MLTDTTAAVRRAGARMLKRYSTESPASGLGEIVAAVRANDAAVVDLLKPELEAIHPEALS